MTSFLDRLEEVASRSGNRSEVESMLAAWKQQASLDMEFVGPHNTRCALCNELFRRFKLFRRRSIVHGLSGDFQVHDRCLNRFATALERAGFDV